MFKVKYCLDRYAPKVPGRQYRNAVVLKGLSTGSAAQAESAITQKSGQFIMEPWLLESLYKYLITGQISPLVASATFLDRLTECIRSLPVRRLRLP